MPVRFARPDASDLVLRAYGRALHPELFVHHSALTLRNPHMTLDARLSAAGHVLILRADSETLTEVISDRHEPLPQRSRLFEHRLKGSRTETIELDSGLRYSLSWSLERLPTTVYLRFHEELVEDCSRASLSSDRAILSSQIAGSNRFSPGPVSLIRTEVCRDSILIHAFHTFPDHLSVVKTQSLFELT